MNLDSKTTFKAFYLGRLKSPCKAWSDEKSVYDNHNPGFINVGFYSLIAMLTLLSLHHFLQSIFRKQRYLVTDVYFVAWLMLACAMVLPGSFFSSFVYPKACHTVFMVLIIYRLVEILSRELWIVLYRDVALTAVPRVLSVALLNYATFTGLFAYLYGPGSAGLHAAFTISITLSAPSGVEGLLSLVQAGYCFLFVAIVIAVFVARVRVKDK